jgi:hypothetical protein
LEEINEDKTVNSFFPERVEKTKKLKRKRYEEVFELNKL